MRSRTTARKAGHDFERLIADYLAGTVDDRIDIRPKNGAKDRGDIGGLRHLGARVTVQCKSWRSPELGSWQTDLDIQRGNDDALVGLIVHKRHGKGGPADQWVTCTVRDLVALLTGERPA